MVQYNNYHISSKVYGHNWAKQLKNTAGVFVGVVAVIVVVVVVIVVVVLQSFHLLLWLWAWHMILFEIISKQQCTYSRSLIFSVQHQHSHSSVTMRPFTRYVIVGHA